MKLTEFLALQVGEQVFYNKQIYTVSRHQNEGFVEPVLMGADGLEIGCCSYISHLITPASKMGVPEPSLPASEDEAYDE